MNTNTSDTANTTDTQNQSTPLTKSDVLNLLEDHDIEYEIAEHGAARTVEDLDGFNLSFADDVVKNLFLRDDKKRNYFLISMPDHKRVPLKGIQQALESRKLTFASENDLSSKLGLYPGAVNPLGLLNDNNKEVQFILDAESAKREYIGCHPCDNTASIRIRTNDLLSLIREHGSPVKVVDFSEYVVNED